MCARYQLYENILPELLTYVFRFRGVKISEGAVKTFFALLERPFLNSRSKTSLLPHRAETRARKLSRGNPFRRKFSSTPATSALVSRRKTRNRPVQVADSALPVGECLFPTLLIRPGERVRLSRHVPYTDAPYV